MLADSISKGDIHNTNEAREKLKRSLTRELCSKLHFSSRSTNSYSDSGGCIEVLMTKNE